MVIPATMGQKYMTFVKALEQAQTVFSDASNLAKEKVELDQLLGDIKDTLKVLNDYHKNVLQPFQEREDVIKEKLSIVNNIINSQRALSVSF